MKFRNTILLPLSLAAVSIFTDGYCQVKPRLDALKDNIEYMQFLQEEHNLAIQRDSISNIVTTQKNELATLSGDAKESKTNEILNFEAQLFDIRSKIGVLNSKISTIEQEYIIANMNQPSQVVMEEENSGDLNVAKLLDYSLIKKELTKTEVGTISNESAALKNIDDAYGEISRINSTMESLNSQYNKTADILIADSLCNEFDSLLNVVKDIDLKATSEWESIFNTKIDLYNRLLDKFIAPSSTIDFLNEASRNFRSEENEFNSRFVAPSLSRSMRQNILVKEYEMALAKLLKLDVAYSNIKNEQSSINKTIYDIENITINPQDFVEFKKIERVASKAHNAKNPIGELLIPTKGEMHKVELATYVKPTQAYYLFKNVSPIESTKLTDGKTRYWAGTYATKEEALDASKALNRIGMRTKVSSWIDGVNQSDSTLNIGDFMIEFKNYTIQVKNIIRTYAPNQEMIESENEEGHTIYQIQPFKTRSQAKEVADMIGSDAVVTKLVIKEEEEETIE